MASCSSVLGLVMIVVTLIGATISLGTSYWIEDTEDFHAGLWQDCHGDKCEFIKVNATSLPKWFNPVRVVVAVSVANSVVCLLVVMGYLCCSCCRYSIRAVQFIILVLLIGCLELACSVVVYWVKHKDVSFYGGDVTADVHLGWSFYLACAAALGFILNIFLMVCETSNSIRSGVTPQHGEYQPIRPTTAENGYQSVS